MRKHRGGAESEFEPRSANPEPVLCVLHQSVLKDPEVSELPQKEGFLAYLSSPAKATHAKLLGRDLVPNADTAQADILMNFHH